MKINEFTYGLFDFKRNKIISFVNKSIYDTSVFAFSTGEKLNDVSFLVYAGLVGFTSGKALDIEKIEIYKRKII